MMLHRNLIKEWESSYERLTQMVVPRSSTWVAFSRRSHLTGQD